MTLWTTWSGFGKRWQGNYKMREADLTAQEPAGAA